MSESFCEPSIPENQLNSPGTHTSAIHRIKLHFHKPTITVIRVKCSTEKNDKQSNVTREIDRVTQQISNLDVSWTFGEEIPLQKQETDTESRKIKCWSAVNHMSSWNTSTTTTKIGSLHRNHRAVRPKWSKWNSWASLCVQLRCVDVCYLWIRT